MIGLEILSALMLKRLNRYQQFSWCVSSNYGLRATANVNLAFNLKGPLDVKAFCIAVDRVVERHEQLRSLFFEVDGTPGWHPQTPCSNLLLVDSTAVNAAGIDAFVEQFCSVPFDLSKEIPFRAVLKRVDHLNHVFVISVHHIAIDGWSVDLIIEDLKSCYNNLVAGLPDAALPAIDFDFETLAEPLQAEERARQLAFWKGYLAGAQKPVIPHLVENRPPQARSQFEIMMPTAAQGRGLAELAIAESVTHFSIYSSIVASALADFCAVEDLVVSTNISPRTTEATQSIVSYFTALLPLRIRVDNEAARSEQAHIVSEAILEIIDEVDLSFDEVLNCTDLGNKLPIHIGMESSYTCWGMTGVNVVQIQAPDYQPCPLIIWVPIDPADSFIKLQFRPDQIDEREIRKLKGHINQVLERFCCVSVERACA